jgi:hypothetical protein
MMADTYCSTSSQYRGGYIQAGDRQGYGEVGKLAEALGITRE